MQQNTDIIVPPTLGDSELLSFFKGWRWIEQPHGVTTLDFRTTQFLSPWAITLFALHGLWLRERKRRRVRIKLDPRSIAGHYAARAGLLELFDEPVPPLDQDGTDRTVKLTRIRASNDIPEFSSCVMKLLAIGDEDIEGAVQYALVELLRNVVQHASSPIGALSMAQYYPANGLVQVVVADRGIGIRSSLRHRYPEIDHDFKALKFAMQPHVSGTFDRENYGTMKDNAGLGLFFIKEIATRSTGGFFLGSGKMIANIWGNNEGQIRQIFWEARKDDRAGLQTGWPGTFGVLQLRRDSIGEFDALLRTCRQLAAEARKYPAELALDFVEEIPEVDGVTVIRVAEFAENVEQAARVRDEVIGPKLASVEHLAHMVSFARLVPRLIQPSPARRQGTPVDSKPVRPLGCPQLRYA